MVCMLGLGSATVRLAKFLGLLSIPEFESISLCFESPAMV